ncbi:MAG TPA: FtsX-like permease family protein, partial [Streptosporangiaceae bacterium]|nr:FtsX-like permease family protein [Streptosporangiaceae bacterium]
MIALAARTARARAGTLAGPFIALALGTALLSAVVINMIADAEYGAGQPRWYTRPAVVVAGTGTVRVTSGSGGDRETESVRAGSARAVPPAAAARLRALGVPVIADYASPAHAAGAPGTSVHPWAAAALHRYSFVAGGPPATAGQVVLTAPTRLRPGQQVTVQTTAGPRRLEVSGVIATPAPAALYAAGPVAARLAGNRIAAIALLPRAGAAGLARQARQATRGWPVQVLTGRDRAAAEPGPDAGLAAMAIAVLGTAAGLAAFMAIFVVSGTFAQSVTARRRELGLLRAAGATAGQLRRLVLGEALLIAILATLPGGLAGALAAASLSRYMARAGVGPPGLATHLALWPVAAAAGACVLIGVAGALAPARRAGRIGPAEALREAAADRRVMPLSRWIIGLAALAGVVPLLAALAAVHSADGAALVLPAAMVLILALVMLAPLAVRPLAALLAPLAGGGSAAGLLARRSAVTAVRRTAAVIAPVVLTAGFAGALLAGNDTLYRTQQVTAAGRVSAPVTVTAGPAGLSSRTVAAIRSAPGVSAAVPVAATTIYVRSSDEPDDWSAQYAGPGIGQVLRLPVVAGSLARLTGTGTIAVPAGTWRLGQTAQIWLDDSAPARLRVVAVYASQIDLGNTVLLPWGLQAGHAAAPLATSVYVRMRPGASLAGVRAAAAAGGGQAVPTRQYLAAVTTQQQRRNDAALATVLGLALLYSWIAIGNTAAMGTASRRGELGALRLAGATRAQVLAMLGWETWLGTAIGLLLAAVATAATLLGVRFCLAGVSSGTQLVIPWQQAGLAALGALAIAELAGLAPAVWALRRRPAGL